LSAWLLVSASSLSLLSFLPLPSPTLPNPFQ
jgi:hypothetical protein